MLYLIAALLGIVAASEVTRLILTHRHLSKKKYFVQKLEGVQKMIWDFEFKVFKTREIREDVRKSYDNAKGALFQLEENIKTFQGEAGDKARLEDRKVLVTRDVQRYEAQMKSLDLEIDGAAPNQENHDGVEGIYHQIDSLRELSVMLEDWIGEL